MFGGPELRAKAPRSTIEHAVRATVSRQRRKQIVWGAGRARFVGLLCSVSGVGEVFIQFSRHDFVAENRFHRGHAYKNFPAPRVFQRALG